ncbi:hypothetical protein ACJMK2_023685 [Sinanodonta woodiana]|uniref:YHYH domain-containing protein n=1 Tax=Sinanodonta woodiana TaxID=1069815 RepID=A0ABD3T5U8_SINWO
MMSCIISVALLISSPSLWTYTVSAAYLTQYEQNTLKEKGITLKDFSHEYWLLKSNGIPKHPTGVFPNKDNPNTISEQNYEYLIPKNPMRLDNDKNSESDYECLDMGVIAFASNGVPLFNPYSAEGFNAVEGPCSEVFDGCNAHPDTLGRYHYHQFPNCLYGVPEKYSRLYGVALDGFPIYGPYEIDGSLVDASKLDECHGRTSNDGRYEYRITLNFPYILGCYRGKPGSQLSSGSGSQVNVRSEPVSQPNNGSQIYSGMESGPGPQNGSAFGPQEGSQSYSGSGSGSGPQVGGQNYFGSGPYSGSQSYSGSGSGTGPQVGGQMYSGSGSGSGPYIGSQSYLGSGSGSGNQVNGQNYFGSGSGSGPYSGSQSYSGSGSGSGNQVNGQNYFGSGSGSGPYSGSQSYSGSGSGSGNQANGQNYFGLGSGSGPYSGSQSYSGSGSGSGNQISGQNYFGLGSGAGSRNQVIGQNLFGSGSGSRPYSRGQSYSGSGSGSGNQASGQNYFGQGSGYGPYSGSQSYFGSGSGSGSLSQSQMQTGSGSGLGFNIGSQGIDQTFGESGSGSWGSFSGNQILPPSRGVSTGESQALAALLRLLKIDGRSDRVRKSLDKYYQSDSKGQLLNGLRELLNQLAATKRADSSCVKDENWMQQEGVCPLKCENPSLGCN